MKLARGTEYGIPRVRMVEMCVGCPYYEIADPEPGLQPMVVCRATGRALIGEALPLPDWCPLPDADAFDEAYTGELEVTSADVVTKMAQIRLHAESIQDYVGAWYPGEHDMVRADDALLFALTQRLGGLFEEACKMLNITDVMVIWDIMAAIKPEKADCDPNAERLAVDDTETVKVGSISEHLCPLCSNRMDKSDYCPKCDKRFVHSEMI